MPSEQEMVKKAHLWRMQNGWTIPTTVVTTEADRMLAQFALLERRETIEECAKLVEAMIGSLAVSEDRARSAGRHGVADCRQSDIETCERAAANIRALTPAPEAEKGQEK